MHKKLPKKNTRNNSNKKKYKFLTKINIAVIASAIILLLLLNLPLLYLYRYNHNLVYVDNLNVDIAKGSSLKKITRILKDNKLIQDPLTFYFYNKFSLGNNNLFFKAGEYNFQGDLSANQISEKLIKGDAITHSLTIAEGLTAMQIVGLINNSKFLSGEIKEEVKEGELLPETYLFKKNYNRNSLVRDMKKAMTRTLDELWEKRSDNTVVKTKKDTLILASIIEKETGVSDERRRVSAVFNNRLKKNMMLQTDPTVIYAITLGKYKLDRQLYYKDLRMDSPYNTYKIKGLPPTPIASPGRASIAAALNPIESTELYFVADGTGGHKFADTLQGHLKNVREWRKIQKNIKNNNQ